MVASSWVEHCKYVAVSVSVYLYIFLGMYLLVDWAGMNEVVAFVIVYAVAYILDYCLTLRFVFAKEHSWVKVLRFMLYVLSFLGLGSLIFKSIIALSVHYIVATFLTAAVLFPLRFLSNKYFVYR